MEILSGKAIDPDGDAVLKIALPFPYLPIVYALKRDVTFNPAPVVVQGVVASAFLNVCINTPYDKDGNMLEPMDLINCSLALVKETPSWWQTRKDN